jgi:hypothetical protein
MTIFWDVAQYSLEKMTDALEVSWLITVMMEAAVRTSKTSVKFYQTNVATYLIFQLAAMRSWELQYEAMCDKLNSAGRVSRSLFKFHLQIPWSSAELVEVEVTAEIRSRKACG